MSTIYFDYAAATPLDPKVKQAMEPWWQEQFYNPSALYQPARQVRQALEAARERVAAVLAAKPSEVIFTAGATESINQAIQGVLAVNGGNVIIGDGEHEAVIAAAKVKAKQVKVCSLLPSGLIDTAALTKLIDSKTVLVSIQYANNELGTIQPIHKISQIIRQAASQRRTNLPLYLHSDGSQAPNYLAINVKRLGVDLMTFNGSKIYGPKYSGCLYVRQGVALAPLIAGGGQEKGLRGGTENVAGSIGFSVALELAASRRTVESKRLGQLQTYGLKSILTKLERVKLNGTQKPRLPNNINLTIRDIDGETLVHYLDQAGVLAATGAACNANKNVPSATLLAIGLNLAEANSSLRLTFGRSTTKAHIDLLLRILVPTVKLLRKQASIF